MDTAPVHLDKERFGMARLDKKRFGMVYFGMVHLDNLDTGHCHIASAAARSDSMAAGDMNLVNIHSEGIRLAHIHLAHIRLAAQNQPASDCVSSY